MTTTITRSNGTTTPFPNPTPELRPDGHLIISTTNPHAPIAIFAPGFWKDVEINATTHQHTDPAQYLNAPKC